MVVNGLEIVKYDRGQHERMLRTTLRKETPAHADFIMGMLHDPAGFGFVALRNGKVLGVTYGLYDRAFRGRGVSGGTHSFERGVGNRLFEEKIKEFFRKKDVTHVKVETNSDGSDGMVKRVAEKNKWTLTRSTTPFAGQDERDEARKIRFYTLTR